MTVQNVDPGETFEVRNLFVADGSALPTATGVNPMLTIMGVSYMVAQQIKAKLVSTLIDHPDIERMSMSTLENQVWAPYRPTADCHSTL